jgi:hypothetical protein
MNLFASAFYRKLLKWHMIVDFKMMKKKGEDCGFNRDGIQISYIIFTFIVVSTFIQPPFR